MNDESKKIHEWNSQALDVILHKVSKVDSLVDMQKHMLASMDRMAEAVTKLAIFEERQTTDRAVIAQQRLAIERLHVLREEQAAAHSREIKAIEARIDTLEAAAPTHAQTSEWVKGAMYGAAGLVSMFVAKQVGLL